jgi:Domain of unknown function (DUF4260)
MTARHFNAGVGKQMSMRDGFVVGRPLILLRLEGAAVFTAAILIYAHLGLTWWAFVALILIPDASMLGYLANARIVPPATTRSIPQPLPSRFWGWRFCSAIR